MLIFFPIYLIKFIKFYFDTNWNAGVIKNEGVQAGMLKQGSLEVCSMC